MYYEELIDLDLLSIVNSTISQSTAKVIVQSLSSTNASTTSQFFAVLGGTISSVIRGANGSEISINTSTISISIVSTNYNDTSNIQVKNYVLT